MSIKLNKILISDPLDDAAIEILKQRGFQVDVRTGLPKDQLISIIGEYDALIVRSSTQVTKDVIEAGTNLKLIGRAGVGTDNIDLKHASLKGIVVINAPGGNTISAVELTCSLILASTRYVAQACAALKNGVWDRKSFTGNEIKGKTLAIIGLGRIGREVASRMQSFGMKTIGFDPLVPADVAKEFGVESLTLDQIWPQADFITVHTPLIPQTKNLVRAETLSKCKKGVRIINVARGGIINENDLLEALQSGQVAGAGLDVFQEEPPKNTQLIQHPKVVCTPHLGASTKEAQNNVAKEIALQFLDIVDGKSVPGNVNAPLLSETLKHQNLIWTILGKSLGKLIAKSDTSANSFEVTVRGSTVANVVKLIKESILVGVLSVRTDSPVSIIAAAGIAESLGITSSFNVEESKCCGGLVTVKTNTGVQLTGLAQGRRAYVHSYNQATFEPPISLEGSVTFFQVNSNLPSEVVFQELAKNNSIVSITRSKVNQELYVVHSTSKLNLSSTLNATFVIENEF